MESLFEPYFPNVDATKIFLEEISRNNPEQWKQTELYRMFLKALKNPDNKNIIDDLKSGNLDPLTFSKMTEQTLFKSQFEKIKEIKSVKYKKENNANQMRATTDMFMCRKCHKKECSYYELQTRSADEPMTKFIRCCNCGYEWRQ
jgi:transcription elongation factor S-II